MRDSRIQNRNQGFTLVEIMIVVAVLAIVTTMAMPGFTQAKKRANEASAISTMKQVTVAQNQYRLRFGTYGTFNNLAASGSLEDGLTDLAKSGYSFSDDTVPDDAQFAILATPDQNGITGDRHFFVNTRGVIYFEDGSPADENSTPIE